MSEPHPLARRAATEVRELAKFLLMAAPCYLAFTTVAFANYSIPSESMVPTIEVDDRVVVSKFAYGYSRYALPLPVAEAMPGGGGRFLATLPARGDVVVFRHPVQRRVMIKRLIGLPGDTIALRGGALYVNGVPATRSDGRPLVRAAHRAGLENAVRYTEVLPGGATHWIDEFSNTGSFDEFGPVTVPAGHFFAMGDNRDNSLDSRWDGMGAVPLENLIGRAEFTYFTMPRLGGPPGVAPPEHRLFRPLRKSAS